MLLAEFVQTVYLPSRIKLSLGYAAMLRAVVRRYSNSLGRAANVSDLTRAPLCTFLTAYRRQFSAVATNDQRRMLLTLARAAVEEGLLPAVPVGVRRLPEEVDPPRADTLDEINAILSACRSQPGAVAGIPACDWWYSLTVCVYWTACRVGALRRTPTASYVHGQGLLVRRQKNSRPQWYPLPASCCEAVEATQPAGRNLLWPWPHDPRQFWRRFRQIVDRSGVKAPKAARGLFHAIRRTTLSLCWSVDPAIAQRQGGHRDLETTRAHYVDPRLARGLSAADVLPEPRIKPQLKIYHG
jgi:integrase